MALTWTMFISPELPVLELESSPQVLAFTPKPQKTGRKSGRRYPGGPHHRIYGLGMDAHRVVRLLSLLDDDDQLSIAYMATMYRVSKWTIHQWVNKSWLPAPERARHRTHWTVKSILDHLHQLKFELRAA